MKPDAQTVIVDGMPVEIEGERNVLELIRKAGIDLPTFCYHSDLSVYGACRLCMVEVKGRGITGACSLPVEPGLEIRTTSAEIRQIRKIAIELLLANGHDSCTTCHRSNSCQLQTLARRLGVDEIRFKRTQPELPIDDSSPALHRDPNKCVLCGDCVRACREIQGIGAIDFAHRGADTRIAPAFGSDLDAVECVHCGQCARVCPTGALAVQNNVKLVWDALHDDGKTVVAQIAPAVRVALGEAFGMPAGTITTGQIAAALRKLGFDQVYDTSFAADLTVLEEAEEFMVRKQTNKNLPQFTSCCPAWVQYAEQYCSDLLPNLSSCKSPQQMFGSLAKRILPERLNVKAEDLVVVAIMPCVAKKVEAGLAQFSTEAGPDVDDVLTTQELAQMIQAAGLRFAELQPDSLDLPLGFKTGAGVIFGASGGVSEAVLRYAVEKIGQSRTESIDFVETRGDAGIREATITVNDTSLKLAIVNGLANARTVVDQIRAGEADYDLVEVMACPGGCVGGAGQPVTHEPGVRRKRAAGLYAADKMLQVHKSQDNHLLTQCYEEHLGEVGGPMARELLHRSYSKRRRIEGVPLPLLAGNAESRISVNVCVGTNCHVRGSQKILQGVLAAAEGHGWNNLIDVQASFCYERCDVGPTVVVDGVAHQQATVASVIDMVTDAIHARACV